MTTTGTLGHRVVDLSFAQGWLWCTCGVTVNARKGDPQAMADAWLAHRRDVGAGQPRERLGDLPRDWNAA